MEIPLAQNGLDEIEVELVSSIFRSGNVTMGKEVEAFESSFAKCAMIFPYAARLIPRGSSTTASIESSLMIRNSRP